MTRCVHVRAKRSEPLTPTPSHLGQSQKTMASQNLQRLLNAVCSISAFRVLVWLSRTF